jgi:hypothetical protein
MLRCKCLVVSFAWSDLTFVRRWALGGKREGKREVRKWDVKSEF